MLILVDQLEVDQLHVLGQSRDRLVLPFPGLSGRFGLLFISHDRQLLYVYRVFGGNVLVQELFTVAVVLKLFSSSLIASIQTN